MAPTFAPFAIRDGNLVTGQQENSGRAAAELVIEALSGVVAEHPVTRGSGISTARFVHPYFNANAWLVMNASHAILIDTASNGNEDGERLAAWAGLGVDRKAIDAWQGFLDGVIAAHPGLGIRVLTGHGPEADGNVLLAQRAYLRDLADALGEGLRGEALEAELKRRYPGYRGAEFQLQTATNPAFAG